MGLPVEFTLAALADIEDVCDMARRVSRLANQGQMASGQRDPRLRELLIHDRRVRYRIDLHQIVVLSAPLLSSEFN